MKKKYIFITVNKNVKAEINVETIAAKQNKQTNKHKNKTKQNKTNKLPSY